MSLSSAEHDEDVVRITLRIPKVLHARIVEASGNRSMNGEIVRRLMSSFPERDQEIRLRLRTLIDRRAHAAEQVTSLSGHLADLDAQIERLQREIAEKGRE